MAVQGWAEHLHVAGLLLGEQIPAATKIQVARADRKSRTGPAQLLENREPLFGAVGACFGEKMRERAGAATAHPPPQLMKLRQSEFLRPADDNGVRARNVETALHDVGGEESVGFAFDEAHHALVQLIGCQLAMNADDLEFGRHGLDTRGHRLEVLNSRADHKALAPT